ncbi:MAG: hypothetical protein ACI4CT_01715, partial [Lachnospiraceae bacterium]
SELDAKNSELDAKNSELDAKNSELDAKNSELDAKNSELDAKNSELDAKNSELLNHQLQMKHMQQITQYLLHQNRLDELSRFMSDDSLFQTLLTEMENADVTL